jgi:glycosyltransferase involved in cell wall biosynthesis
MPGYRSPSASTARATRDGLTTGPVLLVTPHWIRDGGVATHVMASAAALARAGVAVHVLAAQAEPYDETPGVTVHLSPQLLDNAVSPSARIGEHGEIAATMVHMHQFEDPDVLSLMRVSAPVVVSVHGYSACTSGVHYFAPGEECSRAHGPGCIPNLLARGCAHTRDPRWLPSAYRRASRSVRALREADLAISYSTVIDRHLERNGVSRRAVLPLFSTLTPRPSAGHETRRRVLFAGRVVASKGVEVLIRAALGVQAEFVICGDGWQLESIRELAERIGVSDRVRFTGWLEDDALARELAEASVVVMPSLWPEPFGLVGIEAFGAGRPVIASDTGGICDWLEDGVGGVRVPPGDVDALATALRELLASPERQREMGAAGRRAAQARFSVERHVQELLASSETARATWESRAGAVAEAAT